MHTTERGVGSIIENNRSLSLSSPESGGDRLVNSYSTGGHVLYQGQSQHVH